MSDTPTLGIVELVDVCEQQAAYNDVLFRMLGAWVADEPDPDRQRWFATAAHRHAWHAQLWHERRPRIPIDGTVAAPSVPDVATDSRAAWYRDQLASTTDDLATIAARIDAVLDPSTARVIGLISADLADLAR